ncbi:MAG: hypothetical protein WCG42_05160 [Parachlamydiaceae bacterium]
MSTFTLYVLFLKHLAIKEKFDLELGDLRMKKLLVIFLLICHVSVALPVGSVEQTPSKKKILIGSPIRQTPGILREFLESLDRLEKDSYTADFFFVEGNDDAESKTMLKEFASKQGPKCLLLSEAESVSLTPYVRDENTHYWKEEIIWKIAAFKDLMIKKARDENYDYLFLVDSDLVLHPHTVEQLIVDNKDIITNNFWTKWAPNLPPLPQVWLLDHYTLYYHDIGEKLSDEEITKRTLAFLDMLKKPGVYEVGGLGACTLISREALKRGVSFARIKNLTFWGEDRHFCIRAVAIGLSLHTDTHYPAYHIYRESELAGVEEFKKSCSLNIKNGELGIPKQKSQLDDLIAPEIKDDSFYSAIYRLASTLPISTILEIGSSSGDGSTEAFAKGISQNPNHPTLYCMEVSLPRFKALQDRYVNNKSVVCYNVSSVPIESFPKEEEIVFFLNTVDSSLRGIGVCEVIRWLRQDIEYVKTAGVPQRGIELIKSKEKIDFFDMVLIDGSEFTGKPELDLVYGAKFILLDDIRAYKNYHNYKRLLNDKNYKLIEEQPFLRNGYAIFSKI